MEHATGGLLLTGNRPEAKGRRIEMVGYTQEADKHPLKQRGEPAKKWLADQSVLVTTPNRGKAEGTDIRG